MNILLMGGGMDSYAVALYLVKNDILFTGLHVDYGQTSARAEFIACQRQLFFIKKEFNIEVDLVTVSDSGIINKLNPMGSYLFGDIDKSPEIKGRNLVLFIKAVMLAGYGGRIYMGLDKPFNGAAPFKDCTLDYFDKAIKLLDRTDLSVSAPLINFEKQDVVSVYSQIDPNFIERSMSCWDATVINNSIKECNVCRHCKIKQSLRLGVYTCQ